MIDVMIFRKDNNYLCRKINNASKIVTSLRKYLILYVGLKFDKEILDVAA